MKQITFGLALGIVWLLLGQPVLEAQETYGTRVPVRIWARGEVSSADEWYATLGCYFEPSTPTSANDRFVTNGQAYGQFALGTLSLGVVPMMPGKTYPVFFNSNDFTFELPPPTIHIQAPPGYVVQIDGQVRNSKSYGEYFNTAYVRILPKDSPSSGPAGSSTGLGSGMIGWNVSLGNLLNGTHAGALALVDPGIRSDWGPLFTPAFLHYESPNADEVDVETNPYISVITTNEAVVKVDTNVGAEGYDVKFYRPDYWNNGAPTSDPFVKYQIRRPGTTSLSITRLSYNVTDTNFFDLSPRSETTSITRSGSWPNFQWHVADWSSSGQPLVETDNVWTWNAGNSTLAGVVTRHAPGAAPEASFTARYAVQPWEGDALDQYNAGNDPVTTFSYYANPAEDHSYGYFRRRDVPGGGWEEFTYAPTSMYGALPINTGIVRTVTRPYLNGDNGATETTTYTFAHDPYGFATLPRESITTVKGITVQRVKTDYSLSAANNHTVTVATQKQFVDSNENNALVSITKYYRELELNEDPMSPFLRRMVHSIEQPDHVKQSFAYQHLEWSGANRVLTANNGLNPGNAGSRIVVITGTSQAVGTPVSIVDGYDLDDLNVVTNKSTKEVTWRNERALIFRKETHVWGGSQWDLVSAVDYEYTTDGYLKKRTSSNSALYEATYLRGRLVDETDENGVKTSYAYDVAGRVDTVTGEAGGTISALVTKVGYDGAGRVDTETIGYGQSNPIINQRDFGVSGRLLSETPAGLGAFTYTYDLAARSRTITAPVPDSGTTTETYNRDGSLYSVTGSSVVWRFLSYDVETDGRRWTQVRIGGAASVRWSKSWTDWLGRNTKAERPGFDGQPNFVSENVFYGPLEASPGQLKKTTRTGYAPMRFEYDTFGQMVRSGLDLNDNGLEPASNDRIVDREQRFEKVGADWWLYNESWAYPTAGVGTRVKTAYSYTRITGHPANQLSEIRSADAEGNVTYSTFEVNRAARTALARTRLPSVTPAMADAVTNFENGLPKSSIGHDGLSSSVTYDSFLRLWKTTDSRNNDTTRTYHLGTSQVQSVSDGTGTTVASYWYDALGRVTSVLKGADADNPGNYYSFFGYNQRGQLTRQWGSAATPVEYGYDPTYGDRTSMSTFQAGTGWEQLTWPSPTTGSSNTTNWAFHTPSGHLWYRWDAANAFTVYRYNERGQVSYRSWARRRTAPGAPQSSDPYPLNEASAVTTRYLYDTTGALTAKHYNDNNVQTADEFAAGDPAVPELAPTTDVVYAYNRLGQLDSVTDDTGTRDFVYDPSKPWRLASEALDPSFYAGRIMTHLFQTSGVVGQIGGFKLGAAVDSASDLQQSYTFMANGRFDTVFSQRNASTGTNRTFDYGYFGSSSLLGSLESGSFNVAWDYDAHRDTLKSIASTWTGLPTPLISRYDYTTNGLGQRVTAKQSGSAFDDGYGEPTFRRFKYNVRGELAQGIDYLGSNVQDFSRPLQGRSHAYGYDNAGNRTSANRYAGFPELAEEFGTNALNQYTSRENVTLPVSGTAAGNATVAVAGQISATARQGNFWSNEIAVNNAGQPWSGNVSVMAASGGLVASQTRAGKLPPFTQSLNYDPDGNLKTDGMWDYAYDAENRLVLMTTTAAAFNAGVPWNSVKFRYDYAGRRVQKLVYNVTFSLISGRRYLYDGWNLVAEYDTTGTSLGTLRRSYTWGLDLAGTLTGTGGVGALVQIAYHTEGKTYLPTYDGNGNIAALVNGSTGALAAAYEYSPFGEPLRAEVLDATVSDQPFRFSTKFTDTETGLVYYGHRYYSATLGRFINRDPIGEAGGINLYGFCGNDGVNSIDYLGCQPTTGDDDRPAPRLRDATSIDLQRDPVPIPEPRSPLIHSIDSPGTVESKADPEGEPSGAVEPNNSVTDEDIEAHEWRLRMRAEIAVNEAMIQELRRIILERERPIRNRPQPPQGPEPILLVVEEEEFLTPGQEFVLMLILGSARVHEPVSRGPSEPIGRTRGDVVIAIKAKTKITLRARGVHHDEIVADIKEQLIAQGYVVKGGGARFYDKSGKEYTIADIFVIRPEGTPAIFEIKTGGGQTSGKQDLVYPQIMTGDAIPSKSVAQLLGIKPGLSLKAQGFEDGIQVFVITAPGLD